MRTVHAITTGGSVLDILGIFEDRQMAQEVVDEWRENMGVHDDGWAVQELTVWDRKPAVTYLHTEAAWLDAAGAETDSRGDEPRWKRATQRQPVYEWDAVKQTPFLHETPREDGSCFVMAREETPEAAHEAVEAAIARRREAMPVIQQQVEAHEETRDELVTRLVGSAPCPECGGAVTEVWQIDSDSATATVSCAQQHKWVTPAFNFRR